MAELTTEDKQEFLDTVAGVEHTYRITIGGYGGEMVYSSITEEQYNYWADKCAEQDENGYDCDGAFGDYIFSGSDEDYEHEAGYNLPDEAKFEGEWYDQDDLEHTNGADFGSAHISIEKIELSENGTYWDGKVLEELYEYEDLPEFVKDNKIEHVQDVFDLDKGLYPNGCYEEDDEEGLHFEGEPKALDNGEIPTPYVMYAMSVEKGTFFDGTITLTRPFDIAKIKIESTEYPNGDNIIHSVYYDGEEIDNEGGDTRGKSMNAYVMDW